MSEFPEETPHNEVVENYRQPAGIGIDDFPSTEPRWGFSDYLMLALSILALASLAAIFIPTA